MDEANAKVEAEAKKLAEKLMEAVEVYQNEPATPPTIDSIGKAWYVPNRSRVPDHAASLTGWLVWAPHSGHSFWWWYWVGVFHLRPIEGVKPAAIRRPDATHELVIISLNPEAPLPDLDELAEGRSGTAMLLPPDVEYQFKAENDEHAIGVGLSVVTMICEGASADVDFRLGWEHTIEDLAAKPWRQE